MKDTDIVAELRAEIARRRVTVASLARKIESGPEDPDARKLARRLRRQLRGDQDMRMSELQRLVRALGLTLTVEITEREGTE